MVWWASAALQAAAAPVLPASTDSSNEQLRNRWQQTSEQIRSREQSAIMDIAPNPDNLSASQVAQSLLAALNHRQWQAVKGYLKQYAQYPNHEQDASLVALAQAALNAEEGNTAQALAQYQSLLQQYPQFVRARLDYARLLYQDNQMRESAAVFGAVLDTPGLPENVRTGVQSFIDAAKQRTQTHGSIAIGRSRNSNVNQGAGKSACVRTLADGTCWISVNTPKPVADTATTYDFAVNRLGQWQGHHYWNLRAQAYGYRYDHEHQYNEDTVLLQAGYAFQAARDRAAVMPLIQFGRWGDKLLYRATGVQTEWQHALGKRALLSTEASVRRYTYREPYQHNSGNLYAASTTLFYALNQNTTAFSGAEWSRKLGDSTVDNYRMYGARVGVGKNFGDWLNLNATAAWRTRTHDGVSAFWGKRKDRETVLSLYMKSPKIQIFGISPVFTFKNTINHSSADTYFSHQRREYTLKLEKTF